MNSKLNSKEGFSGSNCHISYGNNFFFFQSYNTGAVFIYTSLLKLAASLIATVFIKCGFDILRCEISLCYIDFDITEHIINAVCQTLFRYVHFQNNFFKGGL